MSKYRKLSHFGTRATLWVRLDLMRKP